MSSPKDQYDVTPVEREIATWRAARRLQLRQQYQKEILDPYRTEPVVSTSYYRFASTIFERGRFMKPSVRRFFTEVVPLFGLTVLTTLYFIKRRDEREHRYRTGQVSYADREAKFV